MVLFGIARLFWNFLGKFPCKISFLGEFFWLCQKKAEGMGGGPSAKRRYRGCAVAPGKTSGKGSPALLVPVLCRYLLVNRCSFFFPHRRGKLWPDLEERPKTRACNRVGMVGGRSSWHFSSLWWGNGVAWFWSDTLPCLCMFWVMVKKSGLNMKKSKPIFN